MRVGVVVPAVIQNRPSLDLALGALAALLFSADACRDGSGFAWSMHLLCNRLSVGTAGELEGLASEALRSSGGIPPDALEVVNDRERTVAGAWNEGTRRALRLGAGCVAVMATDARPEHGALDALVRYAEGDSEAALWSACQSHLAQEATVETDGADFSLFAFRAATVERHGWFDENFKPAYFEDNDYYARIVLGGQRCRVLHQARYTHEGGGSQTIRLDAEMAHHVAHWFASNRDYFVRKWGREPAGSAEEVLASYHRTPFGEPGRSLADWRIEPGRE
jgi:hypothetical protein